MAVILYCGPKTVKCYNGLLPTEQNSMINTILNEVSNDVRT
ncbi:MAG: hypothetical protein ACI8XM_002694 [Haloarculaceae archaeon]|jgi:hypothetical protein